jgi:hypothetical protein
MNTKITDFKWHELLEYFSNGFIGDLSFDLADELQDIFNKTQENVNIKYDTDNRWVIEADDQEGLYCLRLISPRRNKK